MSLFKRTLLLLTAVPVVLLLSACGPPSAGSASAQLANYTFSIEGEADEDELCQQIADRLSWELELRGLSCGPADDGLRVQLFEYTYPPERVEEALNSLNSGVRFSLTDYDPPPGPHHGSGRPAQRTRTPTPTP